MSIDWINGAIRSQTILAEGIVGLILAPEFGCASSHIDVVLGNGLMRHYSLGNRSTKNNQYWIGVLLDPETRGRSKSVHEDLKVESSTRISAPRNHYQLTKATPPILFVSAIGITPIVCMAKQLFAQNKLFDMHYCSRAEPKIASKDEVATSDFSKQVHFHFVDGAEEQKLDIKSVLENRCIKAHFYVCDPKGFMAFVINSTHELHWVEDSIHFESFSGLTLNTNMTRVHFKSKSLSLAKSSMVQPKKPTINSSLAAQDPNHRYRY